MSQPQRQYESATLFNVRITDMRHLWEPSREYKGKPQEKPSWFTALITPKTQAAWHLEPALAGVVGAFSKIMATRQISGFPVADGDLPNSEGKSSEWARGHWIVSASTSQQPNIEMVMPGGQVQKLPGKVMGVKSGDFVMAGVTAAVKQNDPRAVKLYLNAIVFMAPGPEIVFANNVSGAELVAQAQAQGMQVQGYTPAAGFGSGQFGGAPQGGFPAAGGGFQQQPAPGGFGAPQGGFQQPSQGGFAPTGAPAFGGAPGQFQPAPGGFGAPGPVAGGFVGHPVQGQNPAASPFQPGPMNGNAAFPSNQAAGPFGAPQQQGFGGGFQAPGGFSPPR